MIKHLLLVTLLIIAICFFKACGLIFDQPNNIPGKYVVDYDIGDKIVFSDSDLNLDTFEITSYHRFYDHDEDAEMLSVVLNNPLSTTIKTFLLLIMPTEIIFSVDYYGQYFPIHWNDPIHEIEIHDNFYKDVYIYENDLQGDSDTLLNKLIYHPKDGILGYRYENGNEYLMDNIIKAED